MSEEKKVADSYQVMDNTAGPAGNIHQFFDTNGKLRDFEFKKGTLHTVPAYVALKCGEINRSQPDNPPFVIHTGDGIEIDTDVFEEVTIEKLLAEMELSLPKQTEALRRKLDTFTNQVERQMVAARTDLAKKDGEIADLKEELAKSKTPADPPETAAGVTLKDGQVIADLTDLVHEALKARAEAHEGYEALKNPSKADLINFIKTAPLKPAKTDDKTS